MTNRYSILLLLVISNSFAFAQLERSHINPSPNVMPATSSLSNVNMSYYTGVANVSIPLHTLAGKDISIPITLDYQTKGIKVQDISTSVGLGWSLNASAFAVTRVVRGLPDEQAPRCRVDASGKVSRIDIWDSHFESCDSEKDIFYFSYPSRAGKMFLDDSGKARTMPYQDIAIIPGVSLVNTGIWVISDELGYRYYFGEGPASREETTYYVGAFAADGGSFTEKHTFISAWYLTRIVSPNGADVATFDYDAGDNITFYQPGARVLGCDAVNMVAQRVDTKITIVGPKYISDIVTNITSCSFDYEDDRQDIDGALRLASISFKDSNGIVKKKFTLEKGCFPIWASYPGNCARLKLGGIKEGVSNPVTTHSFLYNEDILLPSTFSFFTDHYGYFNVNDSDDFTASGDGYPGLSASKVSGICDEGRVKDANENALAGILKEIHTAAGGRTVFDYHVTAGARVMAISTYNGTALVGKSSFEYVGETYKTPVYHYFDVENSNKLIRSSHAYNSVFDLNGINKGYSSVTETFLDGSKIVRTFYNFSDHPDEPPIVGRYRGTGAFGFSFQGATNVNSAPFAPYSSKAWMRGLPKTVTIKNSDDQPIKTQEFFYSSGAALSTVWNMAVEVYSQVPGDFGFYVGDYMLRSEPVYLTKQNNYIYDQSDINKSRVETILYSYHQTHKTFPTSIDVNLKTYSKRFTYTYPTDLVGTNAPPTNADDLANGIFALRSRGIITPIETLEYRKDEANPTYKLVAGELVSYRKNIMNGLPLLNSKFQLNRSSADAAFAQLELANGLTVFQPDNAYKVIESYGYDDSSSGNNAKLTSKTSYKGITTNFEYGYANTLITAESTSLGTSEFKNEYSFNTIFGPLTEEDPNNMKVSYEYDNLGRLKLVRDKDMNIIKRYRYNTAGINEFKIEITTSADYAGVGQNIWMTSMENGESAGITKYIWDFGDGQVVEGTSKTVNHTYLSAGTYTLKLSKVNVEYGKLITTRQITITGQ